MNGTAASVITGATVVISATVAAVFHVIDGSALTSIYTLVIGGALGLKVGSTNARD